MKKSIFCLILLIPFIICAQEKKKKRVLFLGNSYTYVNNLPLLIKNIALANGDTLIYDENTIGGYTFANHYADATSKAKISSAAWDFVVLQAQSQEPAFPPNQVNAQTMPYAILLDSLIKKNNACSHTVFYETWGRKNGDTPNCGFYPPLCTYTGMQNRLKETYKKFADTTAGIMAPAGEAFRKSITLDPTLELYDPDQSHPSLSGSYLTAYVFYELLFQRSTITNTYNPGLTANTLLFLKQAAHNTFHDSLALWNIGTNMPWALFEFTFQGKSYQYKTKSPNMTNKWYFGDGTTSGLPDPPHTYNMNGSFTVSHVVTDGCMKDSTSRNIFIMPTGISQNNLVEDQLNIYPNPARENLYFKNAERFLNTGALTEIRNSLGQIVYTCDFEEVLNTSALLNGLYFVRIYNQEMQVNTRFVKSE